MNQIVMIERYFQHVPESSSVLFDLNKCETQDELEFREEILTAGESLYDPSEITKSILCGDDYEQFNRISISGKTEINGTIEYGPVVYI